MWILKETVGWGKNTKQEIFSTIFHKEKQDINILLHIPDFPDFPRTNIRIICVILDQPFNYENVWWKMSKCTH